MKGSTDNNSTQKAQNQENSDKTKKYFNMKVTEHTSPQEGSVTYSLIDCGATDSASNEEENLCDVQDINTTIQGVTGSTKEKLKKGSMITNFGTFNAFYMPNLPHNITASEPWL